ncbi:hypothetical protein JTE90_011998 [Oedothorax gibbosus]|uniref:Uncharacterized protein n=1 Tax=Oedothorax gibbosus TaxID=931172 RepID=A0AAV6UR06_9ARAC|nr:hypothetical protein JTE90_011998 [Oedothorax gibbosus]
MCNCARIGVEDVSFLRPSFDRVSHGFMCRGAKDSTDQPRHGRHVITDLHPETTYYLVFLEENTSFGHVIECIGKDFCVCIQIVDS